jgi:hypothetical protein
LLSEQSETGSYFVGSRLAREREAEGSFDAGLGAVASLAQNPRGKPVGLLQYEFVVE